MAAMSAATAAAVNMKGDIAEYYQRKVQEGKNKMSVINAVRNKLIPVGSTNAFSLSLNEEQTGSPGDMKKLYACACLIHRNRSHSPLSGKCTVV